MARIRTIKPALVDSTDVAKVSREARYFFTILLMFLDDEGKCEYMPKRLAGLLFPHDEDVDGKMLAGWTEECIAATLLEKYSVGNKDYLRSPTFLTHQVINRPTPSRCPDPEGHQQEPDSVSTHDTLTEDSMNTHGGLTEDSLSTPTQLTEGSLNTHGGLTDQEVGSRKKEIGNRKLLICPADPGGPAVQAPDPPPKSTKAQLVAAGASRCLSHLNEVAGKRYTSAKPLVARLNQVRADELELVVEAAILIVDHKTCQWLGDTKMASYLRPETLWGQTHWPNYLADAQQWDEAGRPSSTQKPSRPNGRTLTGHTLAAAAKEAARR